jgi:hypothetical protein
LILGFFLLFFFIGLVRWCFACFAALPIF